MAKETDASSMTGEDVKRLFIMNKINLNEIDYIKNTEAYNISEINDLKNKNDIRVDINMLRGKLEKKYGKYIGKYLIDVIYSDGEEKVDPLKMIDFAKNLK